VSGDLLYNYFRDYDPKTGRYIESDPIGLDGGINTYTYAGGNPLTVVDPRGLDNPGMGPYGSYWTRLSIRKDVPTGSCTCKYGGETFAVPQGTDFKAIKAAGKGHWGDVIETNRRIGQGGTYDLQRDMTHNQFFTAYTPAANFAVGVYMHGAGYSLPTMSSAGVGYAWKKSSNFSIGQVGDWLKWWAMGWTAAEYGMLPECK